MVDLPERKTIGIKQIAELHRITGSYLSKIFAKLQKAGSMTDPLLALKEGTNYLARRAEDISFGGYY